MQAGFYILHFWCALFRIDAHPCTNIWETSMCHNQKGDHYYTCCTDTRDRLFRSHSLLYTIKKWAFTFINYKMVKKSTISGKFQATIAQILVSHQGFPFRSMRAGGHYHYEETMKTPLCKQNHNAAQQYMPHLQMPCNDAYALVQSPDPTPKKWGHVFVHEQKAKFWKMHFSGNDPTNSGLSDIK